MAFVTSASAVNSTNSDFILTKASTINASLFSQGDNQINFNDCSYFCMTQFNTCMAQPDPYNINLDLCRIARSACLIVRCGHQNGGNF